VGLVVSIAPNGRSARFTLGSRVVGLCVRQTASSTRRLQARTPEPDGQLLEERAWPVAGVDVQGRDPEGLRLGLHSVVSRPHRESREADGDRVHPAGRHVEPAWMLPEDSVFSMRLDPKRDDLILATDRAGAFTA